MIINSESVKIDYGRYTLSRREMIMATAVFALSALTISYLFYNSIIPSLLTLFLFKRYISFAENSQNEKRKKLLTMQFKDLLYSLSSSISTGRNMNEGLEEGLCNLRNIYDEDTPMINELKRIVSGLENRESETYLLNDLANRSASSDISGFMDVYFSVRESGGDMVKAISRSSEILMDKITVEKEISTMVSQKKTEARIITAMPIVILLGLNITSSDYISPLYDTLAGKIVMTMCLAAICFASYLTEKITELEV